MAKYGQGKKRKNTPYVALFSCISCGVKCYIIYLAIKKNTGNILPSAGGRLGHWPNSQQVFPRFQIPVSSSGRVLHPVVRRMPASFELPFELLVLCPRNLSLPKTRSIRKPQCTTPFPSHFVARNCC